mmetsp:Transcript_69285/g.129390  ORF Transcript_69285/g.129390 Transcript_69285/m.129390 type:complete len:111 (+) Transcript_69285:69-401(+)
MAASTSSADWTSSKSSPDYCSDATQSRPLSVTGRLTNLFRGNQSDSRRERARRCAHGYIRSPLMMLCSGKKPRDDEDDMISTSSSKPICYFSDIEARGGQRRPQPQPLNL